MIGRYETLFGPHVVRAALPLSCPFQIVPWDLQYHFLRVLVWEQLLREFFAVQFALIFVLTCPFLESPININIDIDR